MQAVTPAWHSAVHKAAIQMVNARLARIGSRPPFICCKLCLQQCLKVLSALSSAELYGESLQGAQFPTNSCRLSLSDVKAVQLKAACTTRGLQLSVVDWQPGRQDVNIKPRYSVKASTSRFKQASEQATEQVFNEL